MFFPLFLVLVLSFWILPDKQRLKCCLFSNFPALVRVQACNIHFKNQTIKHTKE